MSPREQRQALLLLVMMLVLGFVEMAGVASIFPLIAVLSEPSLVETNQWLKLAYDTFGFAGLNGFFIFLSAIVLLIVVGRVCLAALTSYAILRFSSMRSHSLSVRLMRNFLGRPYDWFLGRHSSDLGKTVLAEVGEVVSGALLPVLQFISQAIIVCFIVGLLLLLDPMVAIVSISVLGLAYTGIYVGVRRMVSRIGSDRLEANRERFRFAQEAFTGIKEVKAGGLEAVYLKRFAAASFVFERRRSGLQILADTPRYVIEVIAVGGMLVVILMMLARNDGNLAAALPSLATFAFAGLRLLPMIQGLYRAMVGIRASGPALDKIEAEYAVPSTINEKAAAPLRLQRSIELIDVGFTYPDADRPTLSGVNISIEANTTVAFIGKTGAGKSTLVDLILALVIPQTGHLLIDGEPLKPENVRRWQSAIGYVSQHIFLADDTIAANIAFGVPENEIDMHSVKRAAEAASLHDFIVDGLPEGYHTKVGERGVRLSGGQRQRVGIARALYRDPQVLILDEATSALDHDTEKAVMDAIKNLSRQKTIIMIAHRLTTVEDCDVIYRVDKGRVDSTECYSDVG